MAWLPNEVNLSLNSGIAKSYTMLPVRLFELATYQKIRITFLVYAYGPAFYFFGLGMEVWWIEILNLLNTSLLLQKSQI